MAFQFTPPTYDTPWASPRKRGDLWRFYAGFPTGYSVLIASGVASTHPGVVSPSIDNINAADTGSGMGDKAAFIGGRTWVVTSSEKTILEAAGYTVVTV